MLCLAGGATLHRWHVRERQAVEEQANSLVHALANTLRTMSARMSRSDVELRNVFAEVAATPAIAGIGLLGDDGTWIADINLPRQAAGAGLPSSRGTLYVDDIIVVWDTVNVGACAGNGWGRRWNREGSDTGTGGLTTGRLYVSVPVAALHARWQRDHIVAYLLAGLSLVVVLGVVKLGKLWQRSALAAAQLQVAEEENRTLAEINLLAAGLAHEIRNPLGIVRTSAQRLTARTSDARETNEASDLIIQEIDRITGRLNELLTFARPRQPALTAVSVQSVVEELRILLADELADAGLALTGPATAVNVCADREQLREVLFNLIHNAIRFAANTGTVAVAVQAMADATARIAVRDHGPGVQPEARARLFSPYVSTAADGSGLGLAIARRICRAHGWTIRYREAEAGGALFEIDNVAVAQPGVAASHQETCQ